MSVRYSPFETRISYENEALNRLHQANALEELCGAYPDRIPQFYSSVMTLYRFLTAKLRAQARSPDQELATLLDEKDPYTGFPNRQRIHRLRRNSNRQRHPLRRGELVDAANEIEWDLRREAASRSKEKIIDVLDEADLLIREPGQRTLTPTEEMKKLVRSPEHKTFPRGLKQESGVIP
jgi:hypothetical protein